VGESPRGEPWSPQDPITQKGEPQWVIGKNDPIPEYLADAAVARQTAVDTATEASTRLTNEVSSFNRAIDQHNLTHPNQPITHITTQDLNARNARNTIIALEKTVGSDPTLAQHIEDLVAAAVKRRDAMAAQTTVGEAFGELAGREVAVREGMTPVKINSRPGSRSIDQAWLSSDRLELVLQECKGPSAELGTKKVPDVGGVEVQAQQGSTAYLYQILREDTALREAIMADPQLRQGLIDGSIKLRYREIRPDQFGHIQTTEFLIDTSKLDLPGWLR
jgi:hypothetical protein